MIADTRVIPEMNLLMKNEQGEIQFDNCCFIALLILVIIEIA